MSGAVAQALNSVVSNAVVNGAISGALAGAASGGTAGLINAAYTGGNITKGMLTGAALGAATGTISGAIGGLMKQQGWEELLKSGKLQSYFAPPAEMGEPNPDELWKPETWVLRNAPVPEENGFYLYKHGMLLGDQRFSINANLGQDVRIEVGNLNPVWSTGINVDTTYGARSTFIGAWGTKEFEFTAFRAVPVPWHISLSTHASVFMVDYKIYSTWVPGVPLP